MIFLGGGGEFGRIWVWVFYTILGLGFGAKTLILVRKHGFWCENIDFCAKTLILVRKKSFAQKLTLIGELRRFHRHSDLRAEILHNPALKSRKKDETEPSHEL